MTGTLDLSALNAAQRRLIKMCGGQDASAVTISGTTGRHVDQRRISEVLNGGPYSSLRLHEIAILEDATRADARGRDDWPPVTRMLAAQHGLMLVRLPEAPAGAKDWVGGIGALAAQEGELIREIAKAVSDQCVTPSECRGIDAKILEVQQVLAALHVLATAR